MTGSATFERLQRSLAELEHLAAVPEGEVWLASQKSARNRCAYFQEIAHYTRVLGFTTPAHFRLVDHRAAVAWKRIMCEPERAAALTARRRLFDLC